MTITPPCTWR